MKFLEKVGNEPLNKRLNFGGDPDHRLDTGSQGLFSGFVTIGRYGKWLFQNSAPKGFISTPIDVLCPNFVKFGRRQIGKSRALFT